MHDMREEFEAWASSHFVDVGSGNPLKKGPNGHYGFYVVATAWKAWQASRAALRVELPPVVYWGSAEQMEGYDADAMKEVLQQAGIEVKQNG
ncbi:hypothetical protein I5M47_29315 [Pseudomonas aeruginosa]|nr:hypothetical protein [Pseudomonas aeruginosa]MBH4124185.1 hypothetical protein [Pseudomonas aeruginosa]MBH9137103.1 hypothetical protein [Pseudomonas aeruginosa]MBH9338540.1 hypothetical protein [Pseudomonas aeruginosa]HEJ3157129.1 hypothetical protein [Pseudomonas aeruginosa]